MTTPERPLRLYVFQPWLIHDVSTVTAGTRRTVNLGLWDRRCGETVAGCRYVRGYGCSYIRHDTAEYRAVPWKITEGGSEMTLMRNESTTTVEELSTEDARKLFDDACQRELGVDASTFLEAYDAKELPTDWPVDAVSRVEFLLPFAR